jgi:hypothetical protein
VSNPTLKDLKALRKLLGSAKRWCRNNWATDRKGLSVESRSETAVAWCLLGGARKVTDDSFAFSDLVVALEKQVPPRWLRNVAMFNDARHRTHKQILALIDKAVDAEKSKCA